MINLIIFCAQLSLMSLHPRKSEEPSYLCKIDAHLICREITLAHGRELDWSLEGVKGTKAFYLPNQLHF